MRISRSSFLLGIAAALGACTETSTTSPVRPPDVGTVATEQIAALQCTARPRALTVSCGAPTPTSTAGGAKADLIVGGQGQFVNLVSSNVAYDGSQFSFDATVQSLIPQPLATDDGETPDPQGVQVFFSSGPTVTGGTGSISVANADGVGAFTGTNQPYFQYAGVDLGADGILSRNETSAAKTWILNVDPTVSTFTFLVYVSAVVQHPKGYVNFSADSSTYALTDSAYVLSAQTHSFTAEVLSPAGLRRPSAVITWSSSDSDIATVDANGTVTAVAPGTVTISAQSDTLVGRATLSVCPDLSVVGAMYVTSGAGASSVCLMAGGANAEYVAIPYNSATSGSLPLTFTGSGIQAASGPPNPNLVPTSGPRLLMDGQAPVASELGSSTTDAAAMSRAHFALQSKLRSGLPSLAGRIRQPRAFAARTVSSAPEGEGITSPSGASTRLMWYPASAKTVASNSISAPGGGSRLITPGVPSLGDLMTLDAATDCNGTPNPRIGRVRTISQRAIIVSDTANPVGGFTTAQYDSIGLEFDSVAYAVDTANFGAPTDLDVNGRVVIFYTRAVNEMSPPASSVNTPGFFANKDLFSAAACVTSNEGEMLYMLVPDPTGAVNSNVRTVSFVRGQTGPTLTHNLEHLINASRRLYVVGGPLEEAWLDEGLANAAMELAFFRTSFGLAPRQNIVLADLNSGPVQSKRVAAFNTYENALFTYLRAGLARPDTTGPLLRPPHSDIAPSSPVAASGMLWAFLRYSSDRVNGSDAAFWSSLVNSNLTGISNIQAAIGGADPYAWARDFVTTMYTDDAPGLSVSAAYTQPSWNFRSVFIQGLGGGYLNTRPLTNNTPFTLSHTYQGSSYFRFGVPASNHGVLTTTTGGATPPSTLSMTIVRTK